MIHPRTAEIPDIYGMSQDIPYTLDIKAILTNGRGRISNSLLKNGENA